MARSPFAKRDMSRAEFRAALKRNGFELVLLWLKDTTGTGVSFGTILNPDGKLNRRASLAHALKRRREHKAKEAAEND